VATARNKLENEMSQENLAPVAARCDHAGAGRLLQGRVLSRAALRPAAPCLRDRRGARDPRSCMPSSWIGELQPATPCLPLYTNAWTYLRKPFVQGLGRNTLDIQQWKYARIDTNWRPS
jgi:hypothetical protein